MTTYSQKRLQKKSNNQSIKSMNTLLSFLTHLLLNMHKYKKPQHFIKCCFTYAANSTHRNTSPGLFTFHYASVNSSYTQTHPPPPPTAWPPGISIFLALDGKFLGVGLLQCKITWGGDEKRGQMPRPPSTRQQSSLIEQSVKCHFKQFNLWFFVSINVLF